MEASVVPAAFAFYHALRSSREEMTPADEHAIVVAILTAVAVAVVGARVSRAGAWAFVGFPLLLLVIGHVYQRLRTVRESAG
jgi:hypothetical protein